MNISFSATKEQFRARKWNLPLTYEPKIEPVKRGDCTQTIRTGRKFKVGDLVRYFTWSGRPYWSKWIFLTGYMPIYLARDITLFPWGFRIVNDFHWNYWETDQIARWDGIVPPTGEALRDVLISKNGKIPAEGVEAQIIRWNPTPAEGRARS